ncbi:MAG: hypothetical protein MZV63_32975 [Marinilabiliales bacterium]|nr:hypothetical protein [Marinilabiliales bacterium]
MLTGLLGWRCRWPAADSEIEVSRPGGAGPYISLTTGAAGRFPGITVENRGFSHFINPGNQSYQAREYNVEGDWSGAAFLLVAGSPCSRGR